MNERSYDDAMLIVQDALLESGVPDFVFAEFTGHPELAGDVMFWTQQTAQSIAQALQAVISSRDLWYDDEVAPPLVLIGIRPRHIYGRCYRASHLARIRLRMTLDEAKKAALEKALEHASPSLKAELDAEGERIAATFIDALNRMTNDGKVP